MTFEFDYNTETDQITIVYDGVYVLVADFDGERATFRNFSKIQDEDVENMLKSLCRNAFNLLG